MNKIETQQQITLFEWMRWCVTYKRYPLADYCWHVPNGGKRHPAVAAELKKMGVLKGAPDIECKIASGGYHGFCGELKTHGEKPSDDQVKLHARLRAEGYYVAVAYSASDMAQMLIRYLKLSGDPLVVVRAMI